MSAYVVSDAHIHALINYAVRENVSYYANKNRVAITRANAEEVGQILLDENYRSVSEVYHDRTETHFGKPESYKFKVGRVLPDAISILKLVQCLDYQSSETDDWETSIAANILAQIKDRAIQRLPGYDNVPWGI